MSPSGQGLGHFAGKLDPAVGGDGDAVLLGLLGAFHDGGHLGHAHAGHHAGGADGARSDPDLDPVGPGLDQGAGPFGRGHVAGNDLDIREGLPDVLDGPTIFKTAIE